MGTTKSLLGKKGEEIAVKFLKNRGYSILGTNFQNNSGRRLGEIDIIAKENEELVFVEVKTRSADKFSDTLPEENITYSKLQKLSRIANAYINQKRLQHLDYRFDAISVWLDSNNKTAKIKHISHL